MAKFEIAYTKTAISEGGYTNNPDDNGNWTGGLKGLGILIGTNYGISAPVLLKHMGYTPSVNDMKYLSKVTVKEIYKSNYWNRIKGDEINDQEQANQIYDMAVNAGVKAAVKLAQKTLALPETGIMNQATLNKLNKQ